MHRFQLRCTSSKCQEQRRKATTSRTPRRVQRPQKKSLLRSVRGEVRAEEKRGES